MCESSTDQRSRDERYSDLRELLNEEVEKTIRKYVLSGRSGEEAGERLATIVYDLRESFLLGVQKADDRVRLRVLEEKLGTNHEGIATELGIDRSGYSKMKAAGVLTGSLCHCLRIPRVTFRSALG